VMVRLEVVFAGVVGVTESQLPPDVVVAAAVKDTAEEADKVTGCEKGVVEPMMAVGVQEAGLGVMAGGRAPVAAIVALVRLYVAMEAPPRERE